MSEYQALRVSVRKTLVETREPQLIHYRVKQLLSATAGLSGSAAGGGGSGASSNSSRGPGPVGTLASGSESARYSLHFFESLSSVDENFNLCSA
jgi:hypothetical protein